VDIVGAGLGIDRLGRIDVLNPPGALAGAPAAGAAAAAGASAVAGAGAVGPAAWTIGGEASVAWSATAVAVNVLPMLTAISAAITGVVAR
jgi:hypothetical protein